ncbi:hypothetical protein D3C72_337520 [compost metagenome]
MRVDVSLAQERRIHAEFLRIAGLQRFALVVGLKLFGNNDSEAGKFRVERLSEFLRRGRCQLMIPFVPEDIVDFTDGPITSLILFDKLGQLFHLCVVEIAELPGLELLGVGVEILENLRAEICDRKRYEQRIVLEILFHQAGFCHGTGFTREHC